MFWGIFGFLLNKLSKYLHKTVLSAGYGLMVRAPCNKRKVWCLILGGCNLEINFEKFQKPPVHGLSDFSRFIRVIWVLAVFHYSPALALDQTGDMSGSRSNRSNRTVQSSFENIACPSNGGSSKLFKSQKFKSWQKAQRTNSIHKSIHDPHSFLDRTK